MDEIARILFITISAETAALLAHHLEIVSVLGEFIPLTLTQGHIWMMI